MAQHFTLLIVACAVVACSAEAPVRGYSNRAPYPAAGFRPDRAFNLPSDAAIAQQLRIAQIIKQQQLQRQQQQQPNRLYGAPAESEASQPQQPSSLYGTPVQGASELTRPQRPAQVYGAPQQSSASLPLPQAVRPQQPSRQYGAPQEAAASVKVQRVQQPLRQYGAPEAPKPTPEASPESLEESKEVETVAAVANAIDNKPGRLTQANEERDTENDETENAKITAQPAQPVQYVLLPLTAAGYTPQKLALFQAPALAAPVATQVAAPAATQFAAQFAKLQLPTVVAPQLLAPQGFYQQYSFASPLQSW